MAKWCAGGRRRPDFSGPTGSAPVVPPALARIPSSESWRQVLSDNVGMTRDTPTFGTLNLEHASTVDRVVEELRRAVRVEGLPLERHEHRGWTSLPDEERDRQSKRNFYRIIDRFGSRRDLLVANRDG